MTTKTNIQYSYAQDESGKIVHINDVPLKYAERGHYYSIDEGDAMIARKGKKVAWHFAHKDGRPGALETYLHKLGKSAFKEAFEESDTFNLLLQAPHPCSQMKICPITDKGSCSVNKPYPFDLKKYYSKCELEKRITIDNQEFVADVCLIRKNLKDDDQINPEKDYLIIEIQVTHASTRKKLRSGLHIIEVEITKDRDIERFRQYCLSEQNGVKFYGFKPTPSLPKGVSTNEAHAYRLRQFQILKNKQIHISDYFEYCDHFVSNGKWNTQNTLFYLVMLENLTTQNDFNQYTQPRAFYNKNDFELFSRQRAFYNGFPIPNQDQFEKQFKIILPSYTDYYIWYPGLNDDPVLIIEQEKGDQIIEEFKTELFLSENDPNCKLSEKKKSYWNQIIECRYEDNQEANIEALLGALYLASLCKKHVQLVSPPAKEESNIDYWSITNDRYFPILVDEVPDNLFS
ncbi:MAG: hypothetical protein IKO62_02845 [Bacteroidales bacterium]|nr:hypothetical protein [Bacteroidales bacterium]